MIFFVKEPYKRRFIHFQKRVQGGVQSSNALSLSVIFRKIALKSVAVLRKMTCNLRHAMSLRHPVGNLNCYAIDRLAALLPADCCLKIAYGVATISSLLKIVGLFCKRVYKRSDILQNRRII